jgi:hypothetical protein
MASDTYVSVSISQYNTVPGGSQTLQFLAIVAANATFSVSFNGNNLTPVALGSGVNGSTVYGADIAPYAGETGTLEFSAFQNGGLGGVGIDDIGFYPTAVPEPSIVALTAMGGLLFGARKFFARR